MKQYPQDGSWHRNLLEDGFVLLHGPYSGAELHAICAGLESALAEDRAGTALRTGEGNIYGARNVEDLWPGLESVWKHDPIPGILHTVLGPECGLVRVLYFDKPPGQTWALPWHRDLTIAVRDNRLLSQRFRKPTHKAGVPHIQAPREVLEQMVTVRLHLDEVTAENGPLRVIPGSHRLDDSGDTRPPKVLLAKAGDFLLMRPLLLHSSNRSHEGSIRHRRVLHLEFAADPKLPDGYAWHAFTRVSG
jgi:hypothetical protein